jgi:CRP/FNR family cyclic AMP-dependent transcriptional regulator
MASDDKDRAGYRTFDKSALLANHPLFRELERTVRDKIGAYAATRKVPRGTTIFMKGDPGTCLFAVCSGTVQVMIPSAEGKNAAVNLIKEGEIFGEIALLDGKPRTADAVAFTDCDLMVIERREFLPLLREQPDVAVKLIEILCARMRRTTGQVEELMFQDLEGRLAKALVRLAESAGPPYRIAITQRELSEIAGVSREETNKQLRVWTKKELVRLERGGITIQQLAAVTEIAAV